MSEDFCCVPLHGRSGVKAWMLVDATDRQWIEKQHWHLVGHHGSTSDGGYAARGINYRKPNGQRGHHTVLLHREILGLHFRHPYHGDHINRNTLDNRRSNLRAVPSFVNRQNTGAQGGRSRFRGVYWEARKRKWRARVMLNGRKRALGYYATEVEAAQAVERFRAEHMPWVAPDTSLQPLQDVV